MITAPSPGRHPAGWQHEMAQAITDPAELCRMLELDPALASAAASASFGLRVPRGFVRRMRRGDPHDPLLRQVLPVSAENESWPGFGGDPLGERAALRAPALLQKYHGRALLIATEACGVHCRYCFRRESPYGEWTAGPRWQAAIAHIAADTSIHEVILSGGDPLSLSDARLMQLTAELGAIPHIRRLRVHTRQPIVLPERVDEGLLQWLGGLPWPTAIVLHANHANEIDASVEAATARLRASGAVLFNQSVLLAGVNDNVAALRELSERLWSAGVLPYYLHLLDRVQGVGQFEVAEARALELIRELSGLLPGYLMPRLVREIAGAPAKQGLMPAPFEVGLVKSGVFPTVDMA